MKVKILSVEPRADGNGVGQDITVEFTEGTKVETKVYTFSDQETLNPRYIKQYLKGEAKKVFAEVEVPELKKLVGKVLNLDE